MREQTSSFEVARTVTELSKMIGSRIRKAYQPHYEQVVLRMSKKGHANTDLVIVRGKRVYNSTRDRPMPPNPSQFAMVLRKHLGNSRFIGVSQLGFDRVLSLEFEHGKGRMSLVIELFRDGNVLLLDDSGIIVQLVPSQDSLVAPGPVGGNPPKFNAAVCVPAPPIDAVGTFKSFTSVQEDPS